MGLLDILKNVADPTKDWPVIAGPTPVVNRRTMQLDAPKLGDPIEAARIFGKPDVFEWKDRQKGSCKLLFAARGLSLEYVDSRLVVVNLCISPTSCDHRAFKAATAHAPDGTRLTPDMDRARIESLFGAPDPQGSDEEVVQIPHGETMSDFFLNADGTLGSWSLYLND